MPPKFVRYFPAAPIMATIAMRIGVGSWHSPAEFCRAAFRHGPRPDERVDDRGFRVVRVPVGK